MAKTVKMVNMLDHNKFNGIGWTVAQTWWSFIFFKMAPSWICCTHIWTNHRVLV